jgi:hypothetical protein
MKRAARTIRGHIGDIVNALVPRVTHACAENLSAKIQWDKRHTCGFCHCGGLDPYLAISQPIPNLEAP